MKPTSKSSFTTVTFSCFIRFGVVFVRWEFSALGLTPKNVTGSIGQITSCMFLKERDVDVETDECLHSEQITKNTCLVPAFVDADAE